MTDILYSKGQICDGKPRSGYRWAESWGRRLFSGYTLFPGSGELIRHAYAHLGFLQQPPLCLRHSDANLFLVDDLRYGKETTVPYAARDIDVSVFGMDDDHLFFALASEEDVWAKWQIVNKILFMCLVRCSLATSRDRVNQLIWVAVLSVGGRPVRSVGC